MTPRELDVAAVAASHLDTTPETEAAAKVAVDRLNAYYGPKVFVERNKMGLCLRLAADVDGLERIPGSYVVAQVAGYIEQSLADGQVRILKHRYGSNGQVLYRSSLG